MGIANVITQSHASFAEGSLRMESQCKTREVIHYEAVIVMRKRGRHLEIGCVRADYPYGYQHSPRGTDSMNELVVDSPNGKQGILDLTF